MIERSENHNYKYNVGLLKHNVQQKKWRININHLVSDLQVTYIIE